MQHAFSSLPLSPGLLTVVAELGYVSPTDIQILAIPELLKGKDLIAQSRTGSGKTAAFVLPILEKLDLGKRSIQAVVLCPSRELSAQVAREFRKFGRRHPGFQALVVAGGEPIKRQTATLDRGVHVVVGTPGRMLDHIRKRSIRLNGVKTVILDEADRMLDMGFQADIETILQTLPQSRQTALFSATFPPTIESMSRRYQSNAMRIKVDDPQASLSDVRQFLLMTKPETKFDGLHWFLTNHPYESVLVFCNLKTTVKEIAHTLSAGGVSADCLHGDLQQFERDRVMARFRNQSVRVLLATDVAARGIDVEGLDLVVNYDLHAQPDVYLHRIGRTGRAGKQGLAFSLATDREQAKIEAIEKLQGCSFIRLQPGETANVGGEVNSSSLMREARMVTIKIFAGRSDKIRPGDIVGALTGQAGGLEASEIGRIEIHDRFSYVAVSKNISQRAIDSLNEGRIKGKRFRVSLID